MMSADATTDTGQPEQPVIFLMGPTASGKTELAVHLVERLGCEIVSVDSAMVYRGMDIGTAKPDAGVLARAPHRLIDIRDPAQAYSAAEFCKDAATEIAAIRARGRIPLLAGGTMLYFHALEHGLSRMPGADAAVRAQLAGQAEVQGWPALHARLAKADPVTAARIHANDSQRIQRALEILELTGEPPSVHYARGPEAPPGVRKPLKLALAPPQRDTLHARIATRLDAMLDAGFLHEVETLRARPDLDLHKPALRAVGYRQLWRHLAGEYDRAMAREHAVIATRQLAKRQLTWLRRAQGLHWLDSEDPRRFERAEQIIHAGVA